MKTQGDKTKEPKTREELDAQLDELEKGVKLAPDDGTPSPEQTPPEQDDGAPPPEPEGDKALQPEPQPEGDAASLREQLAHKDAQLAELQKKLDRASGEYGGTLDTLRTQVRQMAEAAERMKSETASLQAENARLKETVAAQPAPAESIVTDDMRENQPELAAAIEAMEQRQKAELEKLRLQVNETRESTASRNQTQFAAAIRNAVPNYETEIRSDPDFYRHVATPDAYGRRLLDTLNAAEQSLDAETFVRVVKDYIAGKQKTPSPEEAQAAQKAAEDKTAALKAQGAPAPAAGDGTGKKPPTPDQIAKERQQRIASYRAKQANNFDGITAKERAQHEKDEADELKYQLRLAGHEL